MLMKCWKSLLATTATKKLFRDEYEAVYPMNGMEKGMVFHTLKKHGNEGNIHNIIFHEQNIYPIPFSTFDFEVFKKALAMLVEKHQTLRKIYDLDNFAHIVLKHAEPEINYLDLSEYSPDKQEQQIKEKMHEEKLRGTNLSFSLIWRMTVIKVSDTQHYLLFDLHHSLFDGWSLSSFMTELNNTYLNSKNDTTYVPEKLTVSFKDQINGEIAASLSAKSTDYWRKELQDYQRLQFASTGLPHEYKHDFYDLGGELRTDLQKVASQYNTSFKHLCFAAYVYTMKMVTSTSDVALGIVTNNRPVVNDGEKLLGCFLNTVPFRAQVKDEGTWGDYITFYRA